MDNRSKYSNLSDDVRQSEHEQCELMTAFGKIACAGSNSLQALSGDDKSWGDFTCMVCDATELQTPGRLYWDKDISDESWKEVIAALSVVTQQAEFEKAPRPRILMAVAIRRIFNHISDPDYLDLDISPLGKWIINAMTRSTRELRIAASSALMVFLGHDVPEKVRNKNRRDMMQFFLELTKRNAPSVQETLIMTYGQAARTCGEIERQIILGQLVEYLGHTNTVIYGAAFNELLYLSEHLNISTAEMLRAYWKTIGYKVVSEINSKPQKAQLLGQIVEMSVPMLLCDIHPHVIPTLVLNKRKDVIRRIAKAKDTTAEDVCMQPSLGAILALLLCQTGDDIEKRAMDSLVAVAPGFRDERFPLHELIVQEAAVAACEVLKMAADSDEAGGNKQIVSIGSRFIHHG
jgi:serine/threonine-protein kinase ATR